MLLDIVSEEVLTKVKETYSATKAIVPRLSIALGVLIVGYFISLFLVDLIISLNAWVHSFLRLF